MKKSITYTLVLLLGFLISCEMYQVMDESQKEDIPEEFRQDMENLLDNYIELKDALVLSDAEKSASVAGSFLHQLNNINDEGVKTRHADVWRSLHESMEYHCEKLVDEEDLEQQRIHFKMISESMIEMMAEFRPVDHDVFHQSCPMFGSGTADWLSRGEQIRNPYHGEGMMNCGENMGNMNHDNHDHGNGHGYGGHHGGGH